MRILVLTDKYFPKPYANAICAQALIDEFNRQGIDVTVLAYKDCGVSAVESWNHNPVIYINPDLRQKLFYYADNRSSSKLANIARRLAIFLNRSRKLFLIPWQPMYSVLLPIKIEKKIEKYYYDNGFDAIVSILNPFELSIGACNFKKKHPSVPVVVYAVDTLRNKFIKKDIAFASGFFWEKRILEKCNAYFYMQSRKLEFTSQRYNLYRDKLIRVDLPRLEFKNSIMKPYIFDDSVENWVYAGSVGGIHYNYYDMLNIFKNISQRRKIVMHMYIRGNDSENIRKIAEAQNIPIIVHDYVDHNELYSIMAGCDVLTTLKTSNQISAKIFECMSFLKPIVHFSGVVDDPNVYYYQKCDAYKVIKMYNTDIDKEIDELEEYLNRVKELDISETFIKAIYHENLPVFSVSSILRFIREDVQ